MNLIGGDCLQKLKDLSANSVDIVIADLPYGRLNLKWDIPINLEKLWKELNRVCKPTTPIFLFGDMKFGVELITSNPKDFKYEIVWEKNQTTTPLMAKKRLGKATEYIFVFYKKQCCYNYAKYHKIKRIKNPAIHRILGGEGKMGGKVNCYEPSLPLNIIKCGNCRTRNKRIKKITEKPQYVLEFLLKYFSNEGDVCLDFCMGSGSCGVACNTLGRKFIGIEKNPEHFKIAQQRLEELKRQNLSVW